MRPFLRGLLSLAAIFIGLIPVIVMADPPQPPFPAFRQSLEEALTAKGLDPQHQTFHFVVLLDNVRSADPVGEGMDAIVEGLLDQYLIMTKGASDRISLATFQLNALPSNSAWNLPFTPDAVDTVKKLIPLGPQLEGAHLGGNDKEAALLLALKTVSNPRNAIYIVLGDTEKSQTPINEPNYSLARDSAEFKKIAGEYDMVTWTSMSLPTVGQNAVPIYYRIYLPRGLAPLSTLSGTSRADILSNSETGVPKTTASSNAATLHTVRPPPEPSTVPTPSGEIVAGLLTALAVALGLGYFLWLRVLRNVQIGPTVGSIRFGTATYIVSQGQDLLLTPKPGGKRIARLEVTPAGDVVMTGEGSYAFSRGKSKVILTNTDKKYWLEDKRNGGDGYELNARRVR